MKQKAEAITVIGRIAEGVTLLDGQTVKTKTLIAELKKYYPQKEIICVDMFEYKKNALKILKDTCKGFLKSEHIIVLLSRNGRAFFFPLLNGLNRIFKRKIYHDVIGGALAGEAKSNPVLLRQLKKFEVNWVELTAMKDDLKKLGVTNVEVLPNFKNLSILKEEELDAAWEFPLIFTMFSRVIKTKGIEDAVYAIAEVNRRYSEKKAVLKIYGPVEEGYKEEFYNLVKKHSDFVSYEGCIAYQDSVSVLKQSYMLLFPSTYPGEGLPGTIIDAFSAGVPVLATNWHFNAELINEGKTGFCYDWKNPELLTEKIIYAMEHPEQILEMKSCCLKEAQRYMPESVMQKIVQTLSEDSEKGM